MLFNNPVNIGISLEENGLHLIAHKNEKIMAWSSISIPNFSSEESPARQKKLTEALMGFMATKRIKKPLITILPFNDEIVTAPLVMGKLGGKELENAISWEIEKLFGKPESSYYWTYGATNADPNAKDLELSIMAMDKALAEQYAISCQKAGAMLKGFVPRPWHLAYLGKNSHEYTAFVDIGPNSMTVNIVKNTVHFTRDIRHGFASALDMINSPEPQEMVNNLLNKGIDNCDIPDVKVALSRLGERLNQTFDFASRQLQIDVSRVVILGEGAQIKGLPALLSESCGHPVEILQAIGQFSFANEELKKQAWDSHFLLYGALFASLTHMPLIGSGAKGVASSPFSLKYFSYYAVAAVVILAIVLKAQSYALERDLKNVENALAKLRPSLSELNQLGDKTAKISDTRFHIEGILAHRVKWAGVITNITNALSQDSWITNFSASNAKGAKDQNGPISINIDGYCLDHSSLGETLRNLQELHFLEKITLTSSSSDNVGNKPVVRFSITGLVK